MLKKLKPIDWKKTRALLASYGRSFLAAAVTAYVTGADNAEDIAKAGAVAILPVLIRWINPNDKAFGRKK